MNFIKNFSVAVFIFVAGIVLLSIMLGIHLWVGASVALGALAGGVTLLKGWFGLAERYPRHRAAAVGMILASAVALLALPGLAVLERAAELEELKSTDQEAYLVAIKEEKGDGAWLEALKELKPEQYKEEIDRREAIELEEREQQLAAQLREEELRRAEEERKKNERRNEIAALVKELKTIPASEYRENALRYKRLTELDPSNEQFREKYQHYQGKLDQERRWRSNPEDALTIIRWNWSKEGFDNIMIATFTIKNNANFDIKDAEITCIHSTPSGTQIDRNTRTIYEVFRAGRTRTIREFNMGFIHTQATRSGCTIVDASIR